VNSRSEKNSAAQPGATGSSTPSAPADAQPFTPADCEPLTPAAALREATRLAERLKESAIEVEDGVTWAGFAYAPESGSFQPYRIGFELHNGSCGVALFLSALERVTGGAGFRETALEALRPITRALRGEGTAHGRQTLRDLNIGGVTGLGSIVYALTRSGLLLGEPGPVEDARSLAAGLTPEGICAGASFDITDGAAGAVLGLLTLYDDAGDRHSLALARACGLYLLEGRTAAPSGLRAWPTYEGRLLTGFSHGAAGIAYALLRLYGATSDERFLSAAAEAVEYEQSIFDAQVMNWPDYRVIDRPAYSASWCHGAPGIGLARLGGRGLLDTHATRADIEAALETTLRRGLRPHDHLCCGSLGTAEVLLEAGLALGRPALVRAARERGAFVVERARRAGSYRLADDRPDEFAAPGFFIGIAGIGYELLRLGFPEQLPSALRLE
jgi:type 2 lantibiotic biosynthesis protein LanM